MRLYELMVDPDCTLRSTPYSYGLYTTREKAETALLKLNLKDWQYSAIALREVE